MNRIGLTVGGLGFLALSGALLPLAKAGALSVNVATIGGILLLLYLLPLALMIAGLLNHLGKLNDLHRVVLPLSIAGLLLSALGYYASVYFLADLSTGVMGELASGLNALLSGKEGKFALEKPSMGSGTVVAVLSYAIAGILTDVNARKTTAQPKRAERMLQTVQSMPSEPSALSTDTTF